MRNLLGLILLTITTSASALPSCLERPPESTLRDVNSISSIQEWTDRSGRMSPVRTTLYTNGVKASSSLRRFNENDAYEFESYAYDTQGLLQSITTRSDSKHEVVTYTYDQQNRITSEKLERINSVILPNTVGVRAYNICTYPKEGVVQKDPANVSNGARNVGEFDTLGRITRLTSWYDPRGPIESVLTFEYQNDRLSLYRQTIYNQAGGVDSTSVGTYDTMGRLVDVDSEDVDLGPIRLKVEYANVDEHGNWTLKKNVLNGTVVSVDYRVIAYTK